MTKDDPTPLPWERIEGETPTEYALFVEYRGMSVIWRSVLELRKHAGRLGLDHDGLKEIATRNRWDERVALYDEHAVTKADLQARAMVYRGKRDLIGILHLELARVCLARLLQSARENPDFMLPSAEIIAHGAAGSKMGEKVLGELTAKVGIVDARLADDLKKAATLQELDEIAKRYGLDDIGGTEN